MDETTKPKRPKVKVKPGFQKDGRKTSEIIAELKEQKRLAALKKKKPKKAVPLVKTSTETDVGLNPTVKELVRLMVWEGLPRRAAIVKLGKSEAYSYKIMRSPSFLKHYRAELEVLRSNSHARLHHRLEEILEQDDNLNAAVNAAKVMSGLDGNNKQNQTVVNVNVTPGYVIDVSSALSPKQHGKTIDHASPLSDMRKSPASDIIEVEP